MGQTHAKRGEADELGGVCRDGKREAAMREERSSQEEVRRKEAQRELKGKAKLTDRDIEEEEEEAATTTRRQERQQPHIEAVQHEVQEPLAVFGPQLLGSDSFHADLERQKQIEASLEEVRPWLACIRVRVWCVRGACLDGLLTSLATA
jgi:DNA repair exonuclease SbcCD ATPase subunit